MGKKKESSTVVPVVATKVKKTKIEKAPKAAKEAKAVKPPKKAAKAVKSAKAVLAPVPKVGKAPRADGEEKKKKRVNREIRYLVKGPFFTAIQRWVKKESGGTVRIHSDAMPIFEGNLDFLQSRFLAASVAALSLNSKRKTLSRKDGRYAIANILGKPQYSDLQIAVLNAEAEAIVKYKEAVTK